MASRRIKCSNPKCDGVFAHVLGSKTIDMKRQDAKIVVQGGDYSVYATCAKCGETTTLFVTNGRLEEEDVEFKEDGELSDEDKAELERKRAEEAARNAETEDDATHGGKQASAATDEEDEPVASASGGSRAGSYLER